MTGYPEKGTPGLDAATRLAVDRTRLSYERTMMAWVRTATSLITFGFSIYKFFQIESAGVVAKKHGLIGPSKFALLMISIGLLSLLVATLENRRNMQALKAEFPGIPRSMARVLAALISILGILALIAVIFRQ